MSKLKFDDWDLLPLDIADKIGKRLDDEIKKELHKSIDNLLIQSWLPMYKAANTTQLYWMKQLCKSAYIELNENDGKPTVVCNLIAQDYDEEFKISISLEKMVKNAREYYADDGADVSPENKSLAKALRKMADLLDPKRP